MSTDPSAGVRVIRTIEQVRAFVRAARAAGRTVGLVPTMGALHEGHQTLIRAAARECDDVVVWTFVNPTQFDDPADLRAYPRDEAHDLALAAEAGATVVFAPDAAEVYPPGFATTIHVAGITERWEGESRGTAHFDGVALVVCKMLLMVGPDAAWFGQKDAQQVAVVRRLVTDLDIPTGIRTVPTVRDADGLALSSRNARLTPAARDAALGISRSLRAVIERVEGGTTSAALLARAGRAIAEAAGVAVEYWAIVDPTTFEPVEEVGSRPTLAIVAGEVGGVRLIDNMPLPPAG
jgi:pantoate--beta-alanine ligase